MELAKFEPIDKILIPKEIYQEGFVVGRCNGETHNGRSKCSC